MLAVTTEIDREVFFGGESHHQDAPKRFLADEGHQRDAPIYFLGVSSVPRRGWYPWYVQQLFD